MNLSAAIREALHHLGTEVTGQQVRDFISEHRPELIDRLDTPTFATTYSTLRKKAIQAAETDGTNEPFPATTVQKTPKRILPIASDELTPEETAIAQLREAYKHLVALVGLEVAHSISAHLSGQK